MTREELIEAITPAVWEITSYLGKMDHPEISVNITAEGGEVVDCIKVPDFNRE